MSRREKVQPAFDAKDLAAKAQRALNSIPDQKVYVTDPQHYVEPLMLALGDDDRTPRVVTCVRIVNTLNPEDVVDFGSTSWVMGSNSTIKINDIDGVVADQTLYQFTFLVMW